MLSDNVNSSIKGIVNKPQFDMSIFKKGIAVHISHNKGAWFNYDGIIVCTEPLKIEIAYYNSKAQSMQQMCIPIERIVDNEYTIEFLVRDK